MPECAAEEKERGWQGKREKREGEISTDSRIDKKQGLGGTATWVPVRKKLLLGLSQARPATVHTLAILSKGC